MPRYLISFDDGSMHHIPDEDWPAVVVFGIAVLYSLRGLILIPDLIRLASGAGYPFRQTAFSATALAIGVAHFAGWAQSRRSRAMAS